MLLGKLFARVYVGKLPCTKVTDVAGVTDALYHPDLNTFYTISKRSIKVWDSRAKLSKVRRRECDRRQKRLQLWI